MLRFFKNNSPFTVLILFLFSILVKIKALLHPVCPEMVNGHFLYNYLLRVLQYVLGQNAFAYTFLAIVLIFTQSIYLKAITTRHKLFPRYTYIPAFVYLLLSSLYTPLNYFSETTLVNWLLLGAMDTMFSFSQTTQPRRLIYNAGFLLCMAAMFQFTFLLFFFLLLVGMVMFRPFNLGEWSVALMGYATPLYFTASILFLVDRFYLLRYWPHLGFSLASTQVSTGFIILLFSGLTVLSVAGVLAMRQTVALSNIFVRRDWYAVLFYLIIATVAALGTDDSIKTAWLISVPALSIIISHAYLLEKNRGFSNFIFYFSLVFLLICLWANKHY